MKVVRPIEITEAVFTASSVAEPDLTKGEVEWVADRFSGIDFSSAIPSSAIVLDIKLDSGFFYVLASQSFSPPIVYKINQSGLLVSSYNLPGIGGSAINTSSFTISGLYIYSVYGDKIQRNNISDGSYNSIYDISSEISDSSAIGFYDSKFFICEGSTGLIKRFDSSMAYENFSFQADGGLNSSGSIEIIEGLINVTQGGLSRVLRFTLGGQLSSTIITEYSLAGVTYSNDFIQAIATNGKKEVLNYTYDFVYNGYYKVEDRVIKTSTHKQYECTIATFDDPEVGVDKVPQTWVEVGPTNKWATFDDKKSTKSKTSSPYTIQLVPGVAVDSVAGFKISGANQVNVKATSASSGVVYDESFDLSNDVEFATLGLPPLSDLTIDITFTGGDIEVGKVRTGSQYDMGELVAGVSSDRINYGRTKFDEFGEIERVPKPIVRYTTYPIAVEKINAQGVERLLDSLEGIACVWVGDIGNNQLLITDGYIERSPMVYDNLSVVEYQIKVRGSI